MKQSELTGGALLRQVEGAEGREGHAADCAW